MFKEYEKTQHKGADQDVDTDDDNIEYGKSSLIDDLRKQIKLYQADAEYAIKQINNITMYKPKEGGL